MRNGDMDAKSLYTMSSGKFKNVDDRVTTEEVLKRINMDRGLLEGTKKRKASYLGHILGHEKYNFLQRIMKEKIKGKRGPEKREMAWLRNIKEWTELSLGTNKKNPEYKRICNSYRQPPLGKRPLKAKNMPNIYLSYYISFI